MMGFECPLLTGQHLGSTAGGCGEPCTGRRRAPICRCLARSGSELLEVAVDRGWHEVRAVAGKLDDADLAASGGFFMAMGSSADPDCVLVWIDL